MDYNEFVTKHAAEAAAIVQDSIGGFRLWLSGVRVEFQARVALERKIRLLLIDQKFSHREAMESIVRHDHHFDAAEKLTDSWLWECREVEWKAKLSSKARTRLTNNLAGVFTRLDPEMVFRFINQMAAAAIARPPR